MYSGSEIILYILDFENDPEGELKPLVCLTSHSFEESTEVKETTTRQNNGWRSYLGSNQESSISFSGIVDKKIEDFRFAYFDLKRIKRTREIYTFVIASTDGVYKETIKGIITSLLDNAEVSDFFTFEGTIKGVGEPLFELNPIIETPFDTNFQYDNPVNF